MLRHFPTLLNRWRGSHAQITGLTDSHRTLRIVLRREGQNGHLLISCVYPLTIHAPVEWVGANMVNELHGSEEFVVSDLSADVRIVTGSVEVKEYL
jgi:hypothetical protein